MTELSQTFNDGIDAWRDWQDSPWGRLFYRQSEANLAPHLERRLGPGAIRVLDLGGGNGAEAIRLAAAGHRVTLVDCSEQMLAHARSAARAAGIADRVELVHEDAAAFAEHAPDTAYELVLCHNLVQYLPDPAATLTALNRTLSQGGLLSMIAVNRHSAPLRAVLADLDPAAAIAALDAERSWTSTFGTSLRTYTAEEAAGWIAALGHEQLGHHGIRAVSDYISDNSRKFDPAFMAELEKLEFAFADRRPYPLIARFFHLVSRKAPVRPTPASRSESRV